MEMVTHCSATGRQADSRRSFFRFASGLLAVVLLAARWTSAGAATNATATGGHHHATPPGVGSLDVYAEGNTLHLLYAEYAGEAAQLMHTRSMDAGDTWSVPVRVDAGAKPASRPHRGMDPQIASVGDQLIAVWMTRGTGLFDSGPMVTAISDDGGKSWQPGPNPADDRSTGGHGFLDLATDARKSVHLVWLDSRDGRQGLRHARSTDAGRTWSRNATVKSDTCECCWNTLATDLQGGVHVLFREHEPRDMALASSLDGVTWQQPAVVANFGWQFGGCPHVGGGLTVMNSTLHAVTWTGAAGKSGLYHQHSVDRGRSWSVPHRLCNGEGRRGDIAALDAKRLAAAWDVVADGESYVMASVSGDGGVNWSAARRLSAVGGAAAYPRVAATGKGLRVFWTEQRSGELVKWRIAKP